MIEFVSITNFKSLAEVHIPLGQFNCLVGMNGAGKSTVLQALDFLSQLMRGDVSGWLERRQWKASDLNCKLRRERNIGFKIYFRLSTGEELWWEGGFNRTDLRCSHERVTLISEAESEAQDMPGVTFPLQLVRQNFRLDDRPEQRIAFAYQGSILSALKDAELSAPLLEFRNALRSVRSLELLSPQLLRKTARASEHDIGAGGEKLSAYLDNIKGEAKTRLVALLQKFYPALADFKITAQRSGWKKLSVFEQFGEQRLETEALHLNDGLLRILAVLTQADAGRSMLLLDELENGINQEMVETLVDTLLQSPQQLLVTTHSPLLLNYLPDDVARRAVLLAYKTPAGETRIRRFFDVPRMATKLQGMGPGDALVDTDLKLLTQECMALDRQEEEASGAKGAE